ncbi:hypothetical protein RGQ29_017027 [Quercus rubra]|uniref:Uncharacterized protein n=1 Tax=Quercus rubra TaxID=3512 RepID=A0AAN7FM56_QUERU|nr:hypothetical protein RGQ29_017027 [Quercus rubra]
MCDELNIDVPLVMEPAKWPECCIYRAPKRLRKINKEAYTPKLISIGPFHLGDPELREMEMLKVRYFKEFCYRIGKSQKEIASIIEEKEVKIRHCYSEIIDISSEDFVKMVLLDSTFIIELFLRKKENYKNDYIKIEKKEVKHFTDLIRYSYLPIKHNNFGGGIRDLYTAEKLSEAGVIFKLDEEGSALDMEFVKPTKICRYFICLKCFGCLERMQPLLKMPRFEINDVTESLLRNIVALEQCHYPREAYVCNYMVLLDYLIDTTEDVDLLVEKNIIVNDIGSNKAVATMVNKLGLEIVEENSCYTDLAKDLMNHCAQYGTFKMEYLRSTYFPNLWRGTGTVVGLIVFGFTFWSTIRPYVINN